MAWLTHLIVYRPKFVKMATSRQLLRFIILRNVIDCKQVIIKFNVLMNIKLCRLNLQTVFVYTLHSYWTSTKIPFRLCFHSLCSQRQIPTEIHPLRGLHSARTRTRFGERGFFYSGPAAWNTLPSDLHDITDTSTFRK